MTLKANLPHGVQSAWIFKLEVLGGIELNRFIPETFLNDILRQLLGRWCRTLGSRANNLGRGSGNGDCCSGHGEVVQLKLELLLDKNWNVAVLSLVGLCCWEIFTKQEFFAPFL